MENPSKLPPASSSTTTTAAVAKDVSGMEKEKFNFKSLHFGWFAGHVIVVLCSLLFFISTLLFRSSGFLYRTSYLGVISTYCIVLYNSYKPFSTDKNESIFKRMLLDENTQYLIIAVYFLLSKRIAVTLLPFFVYSVFHVLEFTVNDLIPNVAPQHGHIGDSVNQFINQYHEQSMILVAKIEVCGILTRLVLGLFVFQSTVLSILVYAHFIRMRYYMSAYTRQFLTHLAVQFDHLLTPPTNHPKVPPSVIKTYATLKEKFVNKGPAIHSTSTIAESAKTK